MLEIYLKASDRIFVKKTLNWQKKKIILIEKLLFVLVVFPGEIYKLLADMETEVSLKESKALSGKNIPWWFTQGKLMQTINKIQLLHAYRYKLALYILPLQELILPKLQMFWKNKYTWCMLRSKKHCRLPIGLINWEKKNNEQHLWNKSRYVMLKCSQLRQLLLWFPVC